MKKESQEGPNNNQSSNQEHKKYIFLRFLHSKAVLPSQQNFQQKVTRGMQEATANT